MRGEWGSKNDTPPFFWIENHESFGFFSILSRKRDFVSRLHRVCMEWNGMSAYAVYALFSHFCYVGGFGDLGDPVLPTLRGASRDVVTVYAYWNNKGYFLRLVAFPRPGHGPCKRCKMTV